MEEWAEFFVLGKAFYGKGLIQQRDAIFDSNTVCVSSEGPFVIMNGGVGRGGKTSTRKANCPSPKSVVCEVCAGHPPPDFVCDAIRKYIHMQ